MERTEATAQISKHIRDLIYAGELKPGNKIPSENELAAKFETNRNQARIALMDLEADGLIHRRQGSGSYVKEIRKHPIPGVTTDSLTVAVAVHQLSYRYGKLVASAIIDTLHENGVHSVSFNLDLNDESEYRFIHDVHFGGYNGLTIWLQHTGDLIREMIKSVRNEGFPLVLHDHFLSDPLCDCVCSDNEDIGFRLTEAMYADGCTRIAIVGALEHASLSSIHARIHGATSLLARLNKDQVTPSIVNLPGKGITIDSLEPLLNLMAAPQRPDGLLFTHSGIAEQALPHLEGLGWNLGKDLKIGFVDDDHFRKRAGFPTISIEQSASKIGKTTALRLIERINKPEIEPQRILIKGSRIHKTGN